ncbi:MAG TPA: 30S ribosomal protein S17 [Verrucomicrobiae bacterium]
MVDTAPTATAETNERTIRKERTGEVISDKMNKTIVVRVERRFQHPRFKKVVTSFKKFYAHDEKNEAKVGDLVLIAETRPLSKTKSWRLVQVVEKNKSVQPVAE